MDPAQSVAALRASIRWHRGYRPEWDETPERYGGVDETGRYDRRRDLLPPHRMSLLLGTLRADDGPIATLWVQRPRGAGLRQYPTARPTFALLVRRGRWWHLEGTYTRLGEALAELARTLASGEASPRG